MNKLQSKTTNNLSVIIKFFIRSILSSATKC
jgi:hypothetical protein